MTLRQEIELIENNVLYAKDRVDRICEAIGKAAGGMRLTCADCTTEYTDTCESHECAEQQYK